MAIDATIHFSSLGCVSKFTSPYGFVSLAADVNDLNMEESFTYKQIVDNMANDLLLEAMDLDEILNWVESQGYSVVI